MGKKKILTADNGFYSRIRVRAVRKDNWCQVSVVDSGIGIKEEEQKRIFEPFYRVDTPFTRRSKGPGRGWQLSNKSLKTMAGRCGWRANMARGALFALLCR